MARTTLRRGGNAGKAAALFAALPLLAAGACASGSGSAGSDDGTIVIGMDQDTAGGAAAYASIVGATVKDAVAQINERGGIGGRKLKLIVKSDDNDATKAPTVVRQLLSQGAQALIMNSGGQSVLQVQALLKQQKVPAIAPVNITPGIGDGPNSAYTYSLANPTADFGKVYAEAFKKAGHTKLALFKDDSASIAGMEKALLGPIREAGIQVVATEMAPVDTSDVTAQITRIKRAAPDAMLVAALGGQMEVLVHNTAHQLLPGIDRFSLASIGNQPDLWGQARQGALDRLVFVGSITDDNDRSAELGRFLASRRGGKAEVTAYDAQAYDAVGMLAKAIEAAGSKVDGEAINKGLEQVSGYPASFGQKGYTLSFRPGKHSGTDGLCGLILKQFENGKPGRQWPTYQPECG
ncbi:ABC transporter substrate-binding protein [Actinomadura viridis]|uniref:Branched-chain amino acid transport system substrate-binding protein n=1 Tax=Actinomadura viridis TaxID=58110 RepID=A0A931DJE6_9ACTN|nr:ABC transporter substrate-binding protein [Actinomadura viridis]MBG6088631.1 branched-chain amino acid transport system substrate-binding protein [Actinomadura viridis]